MNKLTDGDVRNLFFEFTDEQINGMRYLTQDAFKKAITKALTIHVVGVNEAEYDLDIVVKVPSKSLGKFTLKKIEPSEVELVCNRVNNFDNNRCINCGAKAGHRCELKTN